MTAGSFTAGCLCKSETSPRSRPAPLVGTCLGWIGRRPSVLTLLALAAGILCPELPLSLTLAGAGIALLSALVAELLQLNRCASVISVLVALALASSARTNVKLGAMQSDPLTMAAEAEKEALLFGYVADEPDWFPDGRRQVRFRVEHLWVGDSLARSRCCALVVLARDLALPMHTGERFVLRGTLTPVPQARNPGDFDSRKYWLAAGVVARLNVSSEFQIAPLAGNAGPWMGRRLFAPLQRWARDQLYRRLPLREAGLLEGLLLGRRGMIDPSLREGFAELGVVHILALSGLHVGYVVLGITFLLAALRTPIRLRWPILLPTLFVYVELTGSKPPVVRAAVMASTFALAETFQQRYDLVNTLALAGLLILLRNPLELAQIGFLLSFAAVLSIGLTYPAIHSWIPESWLRRSIPRWLLELAAVSLAAQLGTLPLTLIYFGRLPAWGVLANLVVVPVTGLVVSLGFATLLGCALWDGLGNILASACWKCLTLLEDFVTLAGRLGLGSIQFKMVPVPLVLAVWVLAMAILLSPFPRNARLGLFGGLVIANGLLWSSWIKPGAYLDVLFLDVGVGDAIVVRLGHGKTLLIDAGEATPERDNGAEVVLPVLQRLGVSRLDAVVITHSHQDHVGGIPSVLRKMKVGRIIWNGESAEIPTLARVMQLADSLRIPVVRRCAGDTIGGFAPAALLVLGPDCLNFPDNPNDASLVLLLMYRGKKILFTGDIEERTERSLLRYGPLLDVDVLKVAHHGSSSSSGEEWLNAVRPELAVVSVSRVNLFGFPSRTVLERLTKRGCQILQTGRDRAVWIRIDEKKLSRVPW